MHVLNQRPNVGLSRLTSPITSTLSGMLTGVPDTQAIDRPACQPPSTQRTQRFCFSSDGAIHVGLIRSACRLSGRAASQRRVARLTRIQGIDFLPRSPVRVRHIGRHSVRQPLLPGELNRVVPLPAVRQTPVDRDVPELGVRTQQLPALNRRGVEGRPGHQTREWIRHLLIQEGVAERELLWREVIELLVERQLERSAAHVGNRHDASPGQLALKIHGVLMELRCLDRPAGRRHG